MSNRAKTTGRVLLPLGLLLMLVIASRSTGNVQAQAPQAAGPKACPGETMPVQATGVYTPKPVPDITVNGQPAPGAIWEAGMRSYWHCHAGGQVMMIDQGVGRIQVRGQRMQVLHKGDTHYAAPGLEHWHGAAPDTSAHFFQVSIGNTQTLWMEEVGREDYMGYTDGSASRAEFMRTGVRKKNEPVISLAPAPNPAAVPSTPATPPVR